MNDELMRRQYESLRNSLRIIVPFLDDPGVVEIMLNADGRIWVEKTGAGMFDTGLTMASDSAERIIRLLASNDNVEVNEKNPRLATKLPIWGARVQASIPPIVDAPVFAFRKPYPLVFPISDYVEKDMLSASQADFLTESIKAKKNILIGGGTGSGKTSFINSLLKIVSETNNRLYIVEDTPELRCDASNKVQVRTNPYYSSHDAVMDALRYRPDRIIVGEIRDGTALDLLKSWNTGHGGGLASVHANDCRSMLDRMCQLIEEVVPKAPRYLVAEAVNICVYITRDSNHAHGRRVSEIACISGYNAISGDWQIEYIN